MKLLREPLFHFLALGAGLYLVFGMVGDSVEDRPDRIVVSAGQIDRLVEAWSRTWQRPPTSRELEGLIEDHIREEILYREALAMELDRDDTIIRRRLRQKMEFVAEDIATQIEPTENDLQAFLEQNADAFRVEPRITFSHVYLNQDRRGEAARKDARRLLAELTEGGSRVDIRALGDPFPLPHNYELSRASEVAKLFGREFADRILAMDPGKWQGPVESGYGLHLVIVGKRTDGRSPALAEVRDSVRREWLAARRREAKEAFYRSLRERYSVTVEFPASFGPSAPDASRTGQ